MKRLGIFSLFQQNGMIEKNIEYLLREISSNVTDMIVVSNGILDAPSCEKIKRMGGRLLFRENLGYDAGAYRYVLCTVLGEERKTYTELLLCNDTFYGPFQPLDEIWNKMGLKEVDFWGLSYIENGFSNHLESYFLVFETRILQDGFLYDYFEKYIREDETQLTNIYTRFEVGLFYALRRAGYTFAYYGNQINADIYKGSNTVLRQCGIPILKKKCFSEQYYEEAVVLAALRYIESQTSYDLDFILEDAGKRYKRWITREQIHEKSMEPVPEYWLEPASVTEIDMIQFLLQNENIYIYGTGSFGRKIEWVYNCYFTNVKGFVVTGIPQKPQRMLEGFPVYGIEEINVRESCFLLALNQKNTREVLQSVQNSRAVLTLWEQEINNGKSKHYHTN